MGKLERYHEIVECTLLRLEGAVYANGEIANEVVFDRERGRFAVFTVGWEGSVRRIHACLVHVDLVGGKVWIQCDHTEDGIGHSLETSGIAPGDIVPAFHPVGVRKQAGFAVA